jgi:hypothetical protein
MMMMIRLCLNPFVVAFWSICLLSTIASSFTVGPTYSNGRLKRSGVLSRQSINVDDEVEQSLIDPKMHTSSKKLLVHWKYVQSMFEYRSKYASYLILPALPFLLQR